jgi:hypothetical protein
MEGVTIEGEHQSQIVREWEALERETLDGQATFDFYLHRRERHLGGNPAGNPGMASRQDPAICLLFNDGVILAGLDTF